MLQQARDFIAQALDQSKEMVWCYDTDKKELMYANPCFFALTGISASGSSEHWKAFQMLISSEIALFDEAISLAVTSGKHNFIFSFADTLGHRRSVACELTSSLSGAENHQVVTGICTDLKDYYEALEEKNRALEHALNESRRLSSILNKTSNILVLTDVDGKITWVNEAFTRYKEYTLEEVIGKKPGPLVYGPETSLDTINILHEGILKKEITRVEILNYSKSGNKMWLDLRIEPIFKNGVPEGYMAIEMDITKRKKDEMAIKERNEKIKEFSFITSHDLRHEFSKVMMLLNMAKTQEYTVDDYKTLFNHLEGPVNRINSIISKINANLYLGDASGNLGDRLNEMDEIREICLVDDDALTNMIHKQIIKIILPQTPIRVYETVDAALNYFKVQPHSNRLIFLDLVFMNGKSGWDFLEEYQKSELTAPVIILSSSIDNADLERSKRYKNVLEYFVKPLTAETLHKYIRKGV